METHQIAAVTTPEPVAITGMTHSELWRVIYHLAETEQERAVLIESFVYELPPRTIQARRPDLFADVWAVYAAKRDLLSRLQRARALQGRGQELLA